MYILLFIFIFQKSVFSSGQEVLLVTSVVECVFHFYYQFACLLIIEFYILFTYSGNKYFNRYLILKCILPQSVLFLFSQQCL